MENKSSLDRLMSKRSRPKVAKRTDLIHEVSQDQKETINNDVNESLRQDQKETINNDVNESLRQDQKETINNDNKDKNAQLFEEIVTVRSTTRLEKSIDTKLRHLCTDEKLTKETWIEAAFLYLTDYPESLKQVNEIAQQRLRKRKEIADLKRAMTMKQRLEKKLS